MRKRYYIAYGSNLNLSQMGRRCPGAEVIGVGILQDHMLAFKGSKTGSYLTVTPQKGETVPVVVWKVSKKHETALDLYEGFPRFYYKKDMQISIYNFEKEKQESISAFLYIMNEENPMGIPSASYLETCKEGYQLFGFDESILNNALERSQKYYEKKN